MSSVKFQAIALVTALAAVFTVSAAPAHAASEAPQPVITIKTEGGFVAPSWQASRLPQLVVYSNGRVYVENPKPSHGYVREMLVAQILPFEAVTDAAKLYRLSRTPKGGWGMPPVADVPNTRLILKTPAGSRNVSIYALGFSGPAMPIAQASARKALSSAINQLVGSTVKLAGKVALKPSVYEVWGLTQLMASGGVGIANPAAIYCQSIGGISGNLTTDAGEAGTCQLPSGAVVDEWVNYRAALATLPIWPEGYTVPAADFNAPNLACTVINASAVAKQLANRDDQGRWLLPSGQAFPVVLRPVLAGESACHRTW